jgi:hypothetical protein
VTARKIQGRSHRFGGKALLFRVHGTHILKAEGAFSLKLRLIYQSASCQNTEGSIFTEDERRSVPIVTVYVSSRRAAECGSSSSLRLWTDGLCHHYALHIKLIHLTEDTNILLNWDILLCAVGSFSHGVYPENMFIDKPSVYTGVPRLKVTTSGECFLC